MHHYSARLTAEFVRKHRLEPVVVAVRDAIVAGDLHRALVECAEVGTATSSTRSALREEFQRLGCQCAECCDA